MFSRLAASRHFAPLLLLAALCFAFWSRVLVTGEVLLPGAMLGGFAPFGGNPKAPWTILQWDALAQYFPWRLFAAHEFQSGQIPLWNPHQFAGTPFLANAQSAVFYPLNFPFWFCDVARAFGWAAFLHSLLASFSTYFLAQKWQMSRAASVLAAISFAFCGYLASWALLPTLFATASWLPLCLLLLERAVERKRSRETIFLGVALSCALLAGHAQIFFYLLLALALRALFFGKNWRVWPVLAGAFALALLLCAAQILPTLELARLGHRVAKPPQLADWEFWLPRALQSADLPSLFVPSWPLVQGTLSENFGYVGTGALLLALVGSGAVFGRKNSAFAPVLALFGLLYALATPLAKLFFFYAPGVSQMGGTGRALVLWSLGAALLAGFGLDFLRAKIKSPTLSLVFGLWIGAELFGNAWISQPVAPREQIYPTTALTTFLQEKTRDGSRILFLTPPRDWLPTEGFKSRVHPPGVLPPNGATVYALNDVNGYDSLSPRAFREWVQTGQKDGISPPLNGNMVLLAPDNQNLDALNVRFVVSQEPLPLRQVWAGEDMVVFERDLKAGARKSGADFYPGWKNGNYEPQTFRFGLFVAFFTLGGLGFYTMVNGSSRRRRFSSHTVS